MIYRICFLCWLWLGFRFLSLRNQRLSVKSADGVMRALKMVVLNIKRHLLLA